jgi:hypothetical protein
LKVWMLRMVIGKWWWRGCERNRSSRQVGQKVLELFDQTRTISFQKMRLLLVLAILALSSKTVTAEVGRFVALTRLVRDVWRLFSCSPFFGVGRDDPRCAAYARQICTSPARHARISPRTCCARLPRHMTRASGLKPRRRGAPTGHFPSKRSKVPSGAARAHLALFVALS